MEKKTLTQTQRDYIDAIPAENWESLLCAIAEHSLVSEKYFSVPDSGHQRTLDVLKASASAMRELINQRDAGVLDVRYQPIKSASGADLRRAEQSA